MSKWLHSGRRRDVCALLYEAGSLRAQQLKNRLTSHYDERIDPQSFHAMLTALEESGHVASRTEGIADVYRLTDAGVSALLDHYDWLSERIEGGSERIEGEKEDGAKSGSGDGSNA
ncbi:PadR family transcriptional regulator [Halopenitus sp. POP-27]|uniref:PadR family transcriptional regulator n=1 Tax=Halopenitus sp. POP-27 TaxID=2994425 RepID=UPI0024687B58|nr:PadR family transcriptional regulator [Halopenitus sp. POP-27]